MNRREKIKLLRQVEAGIISIDSLKEHVKVCQVVYYGLDYSLFSDEALRDMLAKAGKDEAIDNEKLDKSTLREIESISKEEKLKFRIQGSNRIMNKREVVEYTQGIETVVFLPENNREDLKTKS